MDFNKFDQMVDVAGLRKDIEDAAVNQGEYAEVPHGVYECRIEKMELRESKKGDPMVTIWFRIVAGEHAKHMIFMNQVVTRGFQLHIINELLRSMNTGLDIQFETYSRYAELLEDVFAAVDGKKEFAVEYGEKRGFNTFKIAQVFEN